MYIMVLCRSDLSLRNIPVPYNPSPHFPHFSCSSPVVTCECCVLLVILYAMATAWFPSFPVIPDSI